MDEGGVVNADASSLSSRATTGTNVPCGLEVGACSREYGIYDPFPLHLALELH